MKVGTPPSFKGWCLQEPVFYGDYGSVFATFLTPKKPSSSSNRTRISPRHQRTPTVESCLAPSTCSAVRPAYLGTPGRHMLFCCMEVPRIITLTSWNQSNFKWAKSQRTWRNSGRHGHWKSQGPLPEFPCRFLLQDTQMGIAHNGARSTSVSLGKESQMAQKIGCSPPSYAVLFIGIDNDYQWNQGCLASRQAQMVVVGLSFNQFKPSHRWFGGSCMIWRKWFNCLTLRTWKQASSMDGTFHVARLRPGCGWECHQLQCHNCSRSNPASHHPLQRLLHFSCSRASSQGKYQGRFRAGLPADPEQGAGQQIQ